MITIVDYGLGNIKAFQNIYHQLNLDCVVARDAETLLNASKIILPGVGSFDFAMSSLNKSGMRDTLDKLVMLKNIPLLGICVGMQMLANSSEEGSCVGLGYVDGTVRKLRAKHIAGNPLPHMGWNLVHHNGRDKLFNNVSAFERFYFLHSYYFDCNKVSEEIASSVYGVKFTCGVRKNNVYGIQFHPEKSHDSGISLLDNFGSM
jgi:imidazole glycerol-phosphate synthase subunit HisH